MDEVILDELTPELTSNDLIAFIQFSTDSTKNGVFVGKLTREIINQALEKNPFFIIKINMLDIGVTLLTSDTGMDLQTEG